MQANPALGAAWPVPTWGHADKAALDALASILGNGNSSRLHAGLVKQRQIAVATGAFTEFPGERYPNLLTAIVWPRHPHTPAECETAVTEEIDRLVKDGVPARELEKAVNMLEAQRFGQLQDNTWMAAELASAQASLGDWRTRLRWVGELRALAPGDIVRVAGTYLVPRRRSVMTILPGESAAAPVTVASVPSAGPLLPEHPDA
jgi:predicted Zn-dependent peptidase